MTRHVCIVRQRDGYELPLRREAEALRDAGFAVDVVCLRDPGGPLREQVDGVRLYRVPLRRRRGGTLSYLLDYALFFAGAAVVVTALHLRRRYVAVQVNTMPDFLVFCTAVPKLLGARVLVFMKEPTPELALTRGGSARQFDVLARIEQAALRYADGAFTVTEELKQRYVARGADPDKILVVLNGPDPRHLARDVGDVRPDPGRFTAICHGSVEERYGHDTILEAVARARAAVPELRLVVTGTGTAEDRLRELIASMGLTGVVDFRGWVDMDSLVRALHAADVGIVAQKASPYAHLVHTNKMYEYFLLSKPAVLSRLESVRAYVDEDTAAYFEPGDPESLAAVLVELARDRARAARLGAAGRRRYEQLAWDRQREVLLEGYRRVLAGLMPVTGGRTPGVSARPSS